MGADGFGRSKESRFKAAAGATINTSKKPGMGDKAVGRNRNYHDWALSWACYGSGIRVCEGARIQEITRRSRESQVMPIVRLEEERKRTHLNEPRHAKSVVNMGGFARPRIASTIQIHPKFKAKPAYHMKCGLFLLLCGILRHSSKSAQVFSQPFAINVQLRGSMEIMFTLGHDFQLAGEFVGESNDKFELA